MSALNPPGKRIWWKEPVERVELMWIGLVVVWGLIMTFMMPYWHVVGKQNLSNEAYRITAQQFMAKAQAMVDQYEVRKETERNFPVVAPPAGSDVYMVARLWDWWPILELKKGESYRSASFLHGLAARFFAATY